MNLRLAFCARRSVLLLGFGLLVAGPAALMAQTITDKHDVRPTSSRIVPETARSTDSAKKSAIQQQLEQIYAREGKRAPQLTRESAARQVQQTAVASDGRTVVRRPVRKHRHTGGLPDAGNNSSGKHPSVLKRFWKPLSEIFQSQRTRPSSARRGVPRARAISSTPRSITPTRPRSVIRQSAGPVAVQPKQNTAPSRQPSDIQRRLEQLYQRDGKRMPSMKLSDLAKTTQGAHRATKARDLTKRGRSAPRKRSSATSFLKRLLPFAGRSQRTQRPSTSRSRRTQRPHRRTYTPRGRYSWDHGSRSGAGLTRANRKSNRLPSILKPRSAKRLPPSSTLSRRPAADHKSRTHSSATLPRTAKSTPKPRATAGSTPGKSTARRGNPGDLENPFPELSEAEADRAGSPYTGLTLDEDVWDADLSPKKEAANSRRAPAVAKKPASGGPSQRRGGAAGLSGSETAASTRSGNQASRTSKKASMEPASATGSRGTAIRRDRDSQNAQLTGGKTSGPQTTSDEHHVPHGGFVPREDQIALEDGHRQKSRAVPARSGAIRPGSKEGNPPRVQPQAQAPHGEKMRRITERKGRSGLKGFCPVVLRDDLDLADSKSAFSSSYASKTYHFSSAESKAKFDRNPSRYAPAAGGHDVVKLVTTGDLVEGSLDHAVWYRDRLYLFSSRDSLQAFVLDPAKHSVAPE